MVEVQGYQLCGCGELEIGHVFSQCGGVCFACFRKGVVARISRIEVIERARRTQVAVPSPWPKKRKKNRNRARKADHAQRRAMKRLRLLYPDMYDVLYADERMKVGLPPVAKRIEGHLLKAVETYEAEHDYSALAEAGVHEDAQIEPQQGP